ncbi:glycosyltransferase family 2 protein [Salibacter halophilus]|uniref:Glycosyltransferase family 2 protein n=1 Tax=Salibacter halophilus TaxID=1803916 RepID=A0A6N6M6D4_9FLAO|nr:glycosyltransferase family 2 protein [Salibacter halophilus]KAB1065281.1 glycosyltransferase family 2 protein [Salibacter halophilus]
MDISVVIPLFNEEESLPELYKWIDRVMKDHNFSYEVIFIDDGSSDSSWSIVEELSSQHNEAKGIQFRRNYGKSAALNVGFEHAQGDVVITMDADLQDSPDEIPELYNLIAKEGNHLISGWKKKRYDPPSKTIPTKLFNWATRKMSGIYLHDFNCGLKAYDIEVVKSIEVYGEMHRYIPMLAKQAGFDRIREKVVEHRARKYGSSKFGMSRFVNGFLDLVTISFVSKYSKRPMHIFGLIGTLMFVIGFGIVIYLGAEKAYFLYNHIPKRLIADNPLFYIALTTMILGTLLFLAGFLGEMISRNAPDRNVYYVRKKQNLDT